MHGLVMLDAKARCFAVPSSGATRERPSSALKSQSRRRACGITANPALTGLRLKNPLLRSMSQRSTNAATHPAAQGLYPAIASPGLPPRSATLRTIARRARRQWSGEVLSKLILTARSRQVYESPEITGTVTAQVAGEPGRARRSSGGAGNNAAAAVGTGVVRDDTPSPRRLERRGLCASGSFHR